MPVRGAPRPMGDGAGAWGCKKGELLPLAFGALAAAARRRRQRVRARDDRWRSPTTLCPGTLIRETWFYVNVT